MTTTFASAGVADSILPNTPSTSRGRRPTKRGFATSIPKKRRTSAADVAISRSAPSAPKSAPPVRAALSAPSTTLSSARRLYYIKQRATSEDSPEWVLGGFTSSSSASSRSSASSEAAAMRLLWSRQQSSSVTSPQTRGAGLPSHLESGRQPACLSSLAQEPSSGS